MLFSQCAVSISWALSDSHLTQIENIDFSNKTSENSESNETNETDGEDDTEEKELIIIHAGDRLSPATSPRPGDGDLRLPRRWRSRRRGV